MYSSQNEVGRNLQIFHILFGLPLTIFLLGNASLVFILVALSNYGLTKFFKQIKWFPGLIWAFNLAFLYCYQTNQQILEIIYHKLDFLGSSRLYPSLIFGMLVLRMISFSVDFHWSIN